MTRTPLVAAALVLALFLPSALLAQTADDPRILRGKATVLDANTLSVAGRTVRLKWIYPLAEHSPPYRYQPRDREATVRNHRIWTTTALDYRPVADPLQTRIGSATVTCAVDVQKSLDHLFRPQESYSGVCYLGDSTRGLDLNGWLVRHGWARVHHLGSVKQYVKEETPAKAEQAGAWRSKRKYRWCCTRVPDSDSVQSEILPQYCPVKDPR